MKKNSVKLLTRLALLVALSAVAAYVPLPSPTGTVALDSAPGYFAALAFGGANGAVVLGLGHLFSAFKMGFPLGLIHLLVAILMGGCGYVYYWLAQKYNLLTAAVVTILLNGIGVSALLIPLLGVGFFLGMTVPLLFGSLVNVIIAGVIYKLIKGRVEGIQDETEKL